MKSKKVFMLSLITIIIGLTCMGINRFVATLPDNVIRVIGVIILIDLFILTYNRVKLRESSN